MSMVTGCNDCRGRDACTLEVCIFPTDAYITEQQPRRDKELARREELRRQLPPTEQKG